MRVVTGRLVEHRVQSDLAVGRGEGDAFGRLSKSNKRSSTLDQSEGTALVQGWSPLPSAYLEGGAEADQIGMRRVEDGPQHVTLPIQGLEHWTSQRAQR